MSMIDRILDRLGLRTSDFDPTPADAAADQAVVDLLTLAMLVDGTSSDAERERIRAHLTDQDWPDGTNPFGYADAATARVRDALVDPAQLDALLTSIAERLRSDDDRAFALALTRELAGLDGTVSDRETDLLDGLRRRFAGR
jgi:uncharacterized tellurite resistance protein B-like protein